MTGVLDQIIARSRAGEAAIPSVCSPHPEAPEAPLRRARQIGRLVVAQATSNQLNQEGGYAGQRAADFVALPNASADRTGIDPAQIVLGGDHLGPQPWRALRADQARAWAMGFCRLARPGFVVQKVGPALTFAWREAICALDRLAQVAGRTRGDLPEVTGWAMLADPSRRQRHIDSQAGDLRFQRHVTHADRIRCCRLRPGALAVLSRMGAALAGRRLPAPMLRLGFAPAALHRAGGLPADRPAADALIQGVAREARPRGVFEARE